MNNFPKKLLAGYKNFKEGHYYDGHDAQQRYHDLAKYGQKPEAMVVSCCDSRAIPEQIFGCAPGELFTVRNVANLVPSYDAVGVNISTTSALEFAVQVLGVKHVVVMGHGDCGGIKAALDADRDPLTQADFIGQWVEQLAPLASLVQSQSELTTEQKKETLEKRSVKHSVNHLLSFPYIKKLHQQGALHVHGTWFNISKGELWVMDFDTGEFSPL